MEDITIKVICNKCGSDLSAEMLFEQADWTIKVNPCMPCIYKSDEFRAMSRKVRLSED